MGGDYEHMNGKNVVPFKSSIIYLLSFGGKKAERVLWYLM